MEIIALTVYSESFASVPSPCTQPPSESSWGSGSVFSLVLKETYTSLDQRKPIICERFLDGVVTFRAVALYVINSERGEIFMGG